MMSVQEWLTHLRWHYDTILQRHQHGAGIAIPVGGAFIVSILVVLDNVRAVNWTMVGAGVLGAFFFGRFTYKALIMLGELNNIRRDMGLIIKDVVTGKLKDSNEILKRYKRFLDKWDRKPDMTSKNNPRLK